MENVWFILHILLKTTQLTRLDSSVGNKLSLYSEVKNEGRFESYLDLIKKVKTRVAVTKTRISCHLLPIESGRYKKIPRVERLCPLCNRSEIGDEFHYLLKCTHSSLSHIRGIFLESLYSINSYFSNMSCKELFLYRIYSNKRPPHPTPSHKNCNDRYR